ncbi:MAG TPA: alpha/beta fold hydrolase [Acidimicrobiales bacterium]
MRAIPTTDGLTLGLHEHGGTGRPVLLCHATGFHGAVWEPLSAALGDGFERWAVDFRAHGASPVPVDHPLDWEGMGDDVLAAVDAIDVAPGALLGVGHSMGGAALLLAEQARPGTFAGLWIFEPIVPHPVAAAAMQGANNLADGAKRRRPSFPSTAEALANFASKAPLSVLRADALHAYVRHGLQPGEDGAVHLACRPSDESRIYSKGGSHGAFERLGEVACPVVVACGRDEPGPGMFIPPMIEALPHARMERHDHVGHFGPLEAPAEMAAAIAAFAAEL